MWEWLQQLQGGAPAVIGSAAGSALGLISLLTGALFNARLNRRRDDRLKLQDQLGLLVTISAEIENAVETLKYNGEKLANPQADFLVPDLSQSVRIMPKVTTQLMSLPREAIKAAVNAQTMIEQYADHLTYLGGRVLPDIPKGRVVLALPLAAARNVVALNENTANQLKGYAETIEGVRKRLQSKR